MKKIVFTISCLGIGGAERVVSILASRMAEMGYDVTVLALLKKDCRYPLSDKVKYRYIGDESPNKAIKTIRLIKRIRKEIIEINPDVIFSFLVLTNILTVWATRFLGCKVVISERNDPYSSPRSKLIRKIRDFTYNFADECVFQTEDAKNYFNKRIQEKGHIIPNPVAADMMAPYTEKREKRIVAVGRLLPQKNFAMLLRAFRRFEKTNTGWKLEIYGDGKEEPALKNLAKQLGVQDDVTFCGFCDEIYEKIYKAGMYISTSNYEGISNSMLEAMALGIPTIVTDCPIGGARLVVKDGYNGYLTERNNDQELCEKMNLIAQDAKTAEWISRNAVAVRDTYSVERITNRWLKIL